MSVTMTDPPRFKVTDNLGALQVLQRIIDLMKVLPNSSDRLEAWTPDPEKIVELWPVEPVRSPWRPMSTLKQAKGNIEDLDECAFVFTDVDVCDVVEPEFIGTARARGAALLRELKEDVRNKVEPQILRAIEGQAGDSDRQDGPPDPDECERGVTLSREEEEAARKIRELRFSQATKGPAEVPDQQGGPEALDMTAKNLLKGFLDQKGLRIEKLEAKTPREAVARVDSRQLGLRTISAELADKDSGLWAKDSSPGRSYRFACPDGFPIPAAKMESLKKSYAHISFSPDGQSGVTFLVEELAMFGKVVPAADGKEAFYYLPLEFCGISRVIEGK